MAGFFIWPYGLKGQSQIERKKKKEAYENVKSIHFSGVLFILTVLLGFDFLHAAGRYTYRTLGMRMPQDDISGTFCQV